jgi:signal peptidase I
MHAMPPTVDEAERQRVERRIITRVLLLTAPIFLVAAILMPNIGPVIRLFTTPSSSMEPAMTRRSLFVVSRASYGYSRQSFDDLTLPIAGRWPAWMPSRGDIVTFRYRRNRKVIFVKRAIGLPGDTVQMVRGQLVLNGTTVRREALAVPAPSGTKPAPTYVEHLPGAPAYKVRETQGDSGPMDNTAEVLVPPGNLFVLGDNRDNSNDSRSTRGVGLVPVEDLIGRVIFKL